MQLLSSTVDMLDHAVRLWDYNSDVTLSKQCRWGQDTVLQYDINWSACGSVPVETCEKFIDNLKVASRLADDINRTRYEVVRAERLLGPDLPDSIRDIKIAEERATVDMIHGWLSEGRWARVSRWLEDQRIA